MSDNDTSAPCDSLACALANLDERHATWALGYDLGLIHGQRLAAEHLAAELLHRQAGEMTGVAVETARRRHGDSWAELIRQQAVAS